ncbi:O-antigen ligase family protein [Rhodococcus sp. IEGM 1343]|uniref:O-antigen ligase family protein n=1 Tax=Rhodococcus sp. IEGM 1343 TaxID=3082224 RepID=UPI002954BCBD|nr:O-antigen ligase family protein [Rhodococcus sp. IEGM 1343]MDV8055973.1 O-antigen ligase family protein [Rhodococcus sp. IEGM 1343]
MTTELRERAVVPIRERAVVPTFAVIAVGFLLIQDSLNTAAGLQGPATIALAGLAMVLFLGGAINKRVGREASNPNPARIPLAMTLFVLWSAMLLALEFSVPGLQHVTVWFLLPGVAALVARSASAGTLPTLFPWWERALVLAALIYIGLCIIHGPGAQAFPYSDRGAGWVLLSGLVLLVARQTREAGNVRRLGAIGVVLLAIILSESRTPMGIAMLMLAYMFINGVRSDGEETKLKAFRVITTMVAGCAGVWFMLTQVAFVTNRFIVGDGYTLFGIPINTSGRYVIWELTLKSWEKNPWFGNGPGSSQVMLSKYFDGQIAHPHNEYLRLLHDIGIVGLALWLAGIVAILMAAVRRNRATARAGEQVAHTAAILSVVVILLASLTDNVTITVFQAIIFGTMIGLSMAARRGIETTKPAPRECAGAHR